MNDYILQLEQTDDIASIRSRMGRYQATLPAEGDSTSQRRRILLVLPRQNKTFHTLVNMKLLARMNRPRLLEIGLVSDKPQVRDYAHDAGIKAFSTIRGAKRFGWVGKDAAIIPPEQTLPPVYGQEEHPETPASPPQRVPKKRYRLVMGHGRIGCGSQLVALVLAGFLATAFVVGVVMLLPKATVTLTPVAKPLTTDLTVRGDPTVDRVDYATLTFPARVAQVDLSLSGSVNTIEAEFAPAGKASGYVTFINRTDVFQTLPPSTTLVATAGAQVQFKTLITAEIPAGVNAKASVPVIATEQGPIGNVGVGQITRFANPSDGVAVRVINESSFGGGSYELTPVVVNDDKDRLRLHLIEEMEREGLKRLEESLSEQEFISPDTIQVIPLAITFKEFSGDFSDTFSGEMQAAVRGTVVRGDNANKLALAGLEAQVPYGYELDAKGLHFGAGEVLYAEDGVVIFRIVASGLAVPNIQPHEVAEEIAWMSIGEAQSYLNSVYDLATVPGVELEPSWLAQQLGRLPYSPVRVDVVVKDAVVLLVEDEP